MLSTCHQPVVVNTNKKDRYGEFIYKPKVVKDYNMNIGGVDQIDQQLHSFDILRKCYKWYKKLAFRLISQTVLNYYKVYKFDIGNSTIPFAQFLHEVIAMLVSTPIDTQQINMVVADESISCLTGTGRHFPQILPNRGTKKCCVCYAKGKTTASGGTK